MVVLRTSGFTLVETIIAMLLSSLVIVLVATTFLVQNQYYASQVLRAGAQDNARATTELIASEVRSVMRDGIVAQMAIRTDTFRFLLVAQRQLVSTATTRVAVDFRYGG